MTLKSLDVASSIVDIVKPKCVILDHYDNSFPPLTKEISTSEFQNKFANIKILKPQYKETIEL